ncbi:HD-GYP domain-containing protein [Marinomonas algarum]|uniref:HD domain-containing protein n=1 Tax=Marinomonas algarum TaxID=2883105 RepID=A0A9X1IP35_9GAMM|nr:HD domain-containing phosphohydrolase [Marinomonas algarum]MCB5162858.1 HD domain-containing protein [Marinomonas algarum]
MSAFKIESCFGADINVGYFNIYEILDILDIQKEVTSHKRVQNLVKKHGHDERIVAVAMRQVIFDIVGPTLDEPFLPFDPYFSDEKLLTSKKERLYDAQERFLMLCLSVATGRSVRSLRKLTPDLSTKEFREKRKHGLSLFRYFRQELNDHTREYILSYKARMEASGVGENKLSNSTSNEVKDKNSDVADRDIKSKVAKKKAASAVKLAPTSFNDETVTALKLFAEGHKLISNQVERYKRGELLELPSLMMFCRRLIDSHTRNNASIMAIRHIKDASIYLEQHAIGMAVLAIHFTKAMKLSQVYIEVVCLGALLLDLGRFRLPPAMITKTTKMTEAEFDLFRKHIYFGEQILNKCEGVPKAVYQMLIDHHEKIDGSGYPAGKQDQEISTYGKVAAIIDAYDAMTSAQAHKESMTPISAMQKMRKESGLAFDKRLLSVFLSSIGKIPVGSCVLLSNGRVGFVLTLNKEAQPSLIRQVYSMTNKAFIESTDIEINKVSQLDTDVKIEKEVNPQQFNLKFINHLS